MLRPSRPPLGRGFRRVADRIRNNSTPKSHRKRLVSLACQGLRIILGSVTSRSIAASKSARSDVRIAATSNVAFVRGRGPATAPADSVQVSFPWQPHVLYVLALQRRCVVDARGCLWGLTSTSACCASYRSTRLPELEGRQKDVLPHLLGSIAEALLTKPACPVRIALARC